MWLSRLRALSTNRVDKVYQQLKDILSTAKQRVMEWRARGGERGSQRAKA
jgi:hypothetical protein